MKCRRCIPSVFVFLLCVSRFGAAQDTASLTGAVRDSTEAVLPHAEVRITSATTGFTRDLVTNSQGVYLAAALPAGEYDITVSAPGFRKYKVSGVVLRVAQSARIDVTLQLGNVESEVTVKGEDLGKVNTQTSEMAGTITGTEIRQLQLNGRNFTQLITLVPGVSNQTGQDEGVVGVQGNVNYSINGGRVENNNWEVDGGDTMDNGSNSTLNVYPSIEAIEEVQVLTSNYGAQYGRNASGTVEVETKSGTNQFHGSVYEFLRNEAFNAHNYFDLPGTPKPAYKKHDSGRLSGSGKAAAIEAVAASETAARVSQAATSRTVVAGSNKLWISLAAATVAIAVIAFVAYRFVGAPKNSTGPQKIAQISHWDKPMDQARLSPDGHAVAFSSPVAGVEQVFLMLASGGEALQLTNDETDKFVTNFSAEGTEIYYRRVFGKDETWSVPTLGGIPKRVLAGYAVAPSSDGKSLYFTKASTRTVYRADRTGMGEEAVLTMGPAAFGISRIMPFQDGQHLLISSASGISTTEGVQLFVADVEKKSIELLTVIQGNPRDLAWLEQGKSILFSRTMSGLSNIWKLDLTDRSLTQVTFGAGPDRSPMPDPTGHGLYLVNGKSTGYLTLYSTRSKQYSDIAGENATQPVLSRDGREMMYVTLPSSDRSELWVSGLDGNNKVRLAQASSIATGFWSPDDSRVSFFTEDPGNDARLYVANPDGSGLHSLKWRRATTPQALGWVGDQKSVFINGWEKGAKSASIWRESIEGSEPEKLTESCGFAFDNSSDGKYLVSAISAGDKLGIYAFSLADRSCTLLVPGVITFGVNLASDGKSFLYAVPGKKDVTIYRQKWASGKAEGAPEVAMKLPFTFPLIAGGNAYDFSRDLTSVVYARPSGHADLYVLSQ